MDNGRRPTTDTELVKRAQRGDGRAFHDLVDRHAAALYALAVLLVGQAADAEDVLQETFAGAFRGLTGFRNESSVKTWLTRILVRQAARHHRQRGRAGGIRALTEEPPARGPGASQRADVRMDFTQALRSLADEPREAIVLRELQGLSYEEIAGLLGVPRGTVESRLFRARRRLQELLKDYLP